MKTVSIAQGEKFIQKGERVNSLYMLLSGTVRGSNRKDVWDLEPGSLVGFSSCSSETYLSDFTAVTECKLYAWDYHGPEDFVKIFREDEKYISVFVMSAVRNTFMMLKRFRSYYQQARNYYAFLMKMYGEYSKCCEACRVPVREFAKMEIAEPFSPKYQISDYIAVFYQRFSSMNLKAMEEFLKRDLALCVGEVLNGDMWTTKALEMIADLKDYLELQKDLLLDESEDDLYQRYFDLAVKASDGGADIAQLKELIGQIQSFARESGLYQEEWLKSKFASYDKYDFTRSSQANAWEEFAQDEVDYLEEILAYAEYAGEEARNLRADLEAYGQVTDKFSGSDELRGLRKRLTKSFFDLYKKALQKSLAGGPVPASVLMLFNFGFLDPRLAGEEATRGLHMMTEKLDQCNSSNVYTIYEWLQSIYNGKNEPSKNEFDMDYPAYLADQKKSGDISAKEEQELLNDKWKKVEFEIDNMFMANNRMTYGKITSYCPVLCEDDIINSVDNMLVTADKIRSALNYIRGIDYSIFYRQIVFSDSARDINMEMLQKEVLPVTILMPNAGSRAMMWQETSGIKRDTPARFIFPIMTVANVMEMMIEIAGRYRWEICRKIQGVRWNDVTEPSLTSEYSDFIQYYRKNHELSADAKEKIKNALQKSKNNFREVFVKDYQSWINYEAKGSFRVNKVSRDILFRYCPFSKKIRQELKINPMYRDMFEKFEMMADRAAKRLDMLYDRYKKKGGQITKDLQCNREFYNL